MQYFSGRFTENADELIRDFNSSIHFDQRLYRYDIMGSIGHVRGLVQGNVISKEEGSLIEVTLREILNDIENSKIEFSTLYEDIHMNIEKLLIDRIGDVGKKLHTGRSRNDQIALDMRLFTKDEIKNIQSCLLGLIETLLQMSKEHTKTYMPGFTHMQKAQAISFAHYLLAYVEMFKRDYERLENAFQLMNISPLGSAAFAGTTYNIDRQFTSQILGFEKPCWNSIDGVSDRDYLLEIYNALSIIMIHLSRFSEEIIIFASNDYCYLELSDRFSTGSSIMPQKKNPDAAELVRGKSGRVIGNMMGFFVTMKGIPLAYNKDMQEDKEPFFEAIDTVKACLTVFEGMLNAITPQKEIMKKACEDGYINATDLADYLTEKGLSFRDAYKISGTMVAYGIENHKSLSEFSMEEFHQFSLLFENDIYEKISLEYCVEKRKTLGGASESSVSDHIKFIEKFLKLEHLNLQNYKLNTILDD